MGRDKGDALIRLGNDAYNRASAERFEVYKTSPAPVLPFSDGSMNNECREAMRVCGIPFPVQEETRVRFGVFGRNPAPQTHGVGVRPQEEGEEGGGGRDGRKNNVS